MNNAPKINNKILFMPSVTIIIAAYNASDTVGRAVRSALAEPIVSGIIVVDDASNDDTSTNSMKADDGSGRLKVLVQPNNMGPSAARNRAIKESKSDWIGILDADDYFLPERIYKLLAYSDQADLIADDAYQVTENAMDKRDKTLLGDRFVEPQLISFSEFIMADITQTKDQNRGLGFIKPLIRRSLIDKHYLSYQENMRLGEDYEFYARALALGARLIITPEQGYVSVVRSTSLSSCHSEIDLRNFRDCNISLAKLPGLNRDDKIALRKHYLSVDCRLQWRLLINAVRKKDIRSAISTFLNPWPVPFYLLTQLKNEFVRRISKKLKGRRS